MSITTYAELQTAITDTLNRSDLSSVAPQFIELAEAGLRRDKRVRDLTCTGSLTVSQDDVSMPDDFARFAALYHDGPTYYRPIEIVSAEVLATMKARYTDSGVPRFAAILDGNRLFFAPEPDATYTLKAPYHRKLTALSDSNTSNWLLDEHPDIYLYASLLESAPYLRDDARLDTWGKLLERKLEELHEMNWEQQWSGNMRRQVRPIGG